MKPTRLLLAASCLAFASPLPAENRSPGKSATEIVAYIPSQVEMGRLLALRLEIAEHLASVARTMEHDKLIADDNLIQLLYVHEILRRTGESALVKETQESAAFRRFLGAFLEDRDWMESYLTLMNCPEDTTAGLRAMSEIYAVEGASKDFARYKALASAIGAAWSGRNAVKFQTMQLDGKASPLTRFQFFRDAHRAGRLHPCFETLQSWDMEYLVGTFGWDDASLKWFNENVQLPLNGFNSVAWCGPYSYWTPLGDFVQGAAFYKPWEDAMCEAENVARHGGVCGSVSNFAALAAIAHGIPSITLGQPGHCAYAFRPTAKGWVGGFGGPEGNPHYTMWGRDMPTESYSDIALAEEVYGNRPALVRSMRFIALSAVFDASLKNRTGAMQAINSAIAESPRYISAYRHKEKLMQENGATDATAWVAFANSLTEQTQNDIPGRAFFNYASRIAGRIQGVDEAVRVKLILASLPSLLQQKPSWHWTLDKALSNGVAGMSPANTEIVARALLKEVSKNTDLPGAEMGLRWPQMLARDGNLSMETFLQLYKDLFLSTYEEAQRDKNQKVCNWAERSLRTVVEAATVETGVRADLMPFARQEYARLFGAPRLAKMESAAPSGKKTAGRHAYRPLDGEHPAGLVLSSDARFMEKVGAVAIRQHYLFTGAPDPDGFTRIASRPVPKGEQAAFTVRLARKSPVTGVLVCGSEGNAPMAARLLVSEDGKGFSSVAKKVIPRGGSWSIEFPEVQAQFLKLEVITPNGAPAEIHNFVVFGKSAQ